MIYFTSDLHFCHDREFLFKPRGFSTIEDMNQAVVENWNNVINETDDVYVLGDLMLNDNDEGMRLLSSLKGNIHIILGNHDTNTRIKLYKELPNVKEIVYATIIKYNKYRFYLSHYPTYTGNLENGHLSEMLINLYGHTHQKTNFYNDMPFMYHIGLDSHNNTPVSVEEVIEDCRNKVKECLKQL